MADDDDDLKFHIDGKTYALGDFELGELEWLEEYLDKPLTSNEAFAGIKAAVGVVYLVKHRDDETFTLDDARKLKVAVLDSEPKPAAKKRPPKPAAR